MNPINIYDVSTSAAINPSDACKSFGYFLSEVWTDPTKVSSCVDPEGLSIIPCVTSKYCPERVGPAGVDLSNLIFMGQALPAPPTFPGAQQTAPFLISGGDGRVIFTNTTWLTPYGIGQSYLTLQNPNLKYSSFTNAYFGSITLIDGGDLTYTDWSNCKVIDNEPGMFPPPNLPGATTGALIISNADVQGLNVNGFQLLPQSQTSSPSAITFFNTTGNKYFTGTFNDTYISMLGEKGNLTIANAHFNNATLSISNGYASGVFITPDGCTQTTIGSITLDMSYMPGIKIDEGCGTTNIDAIGLGNLKTEAVNIAPTTLGSFDARDSSLSCSVPYSSDSQASGNIMVSPNAQIYLVRVVLQNCFFNAAAPYASTSMPSSVQVLSSTITGWGSTATFQGFNSGSISFSQVKAYSPYPSLPLVAIRNVAPLLFHIDDVDLRNVVLENIKLQQPQFSSIEGLTTENVLAINTPYCQNNAAAPNGTTVICTDTGSDSSSTAVFEELNGDRVIASKADSSKSASSTQLTQSSSSFFTSESGRRLLSLPVAGTALTSAVGGLLSSDGLNVEQTDASTESYEQTVYNPILLFVLTSSSIMIVAYLLYRVYQAATTPVTARTVTPVPDLECQAVVSQAKVDAQIPVDETSGFAPGNR